MHSFFCCVIPKKNKNNYTCVIKVDHIILHPCLSCKIKKLLGCTMVMSKDISSIRKEVHTMPTAKKRKPAKRKVAAKRKPAAKKAAPKKRKVAKRKKK